MSNYLLFYWSTHFFLLTERQVILLEDLIERASATRTKRIPIILKLPSTETSSLTVQSNYTVQFSLYQPYVYRKR
jgi:hypothetical protein